MKEMTIEGNAYITNLRKKFTPSFVPSNLLEDVTDFAYDMCFGVGFHRQHRTGGLFDRNPLEQFCNVVQGKLAESVVRYYLTQNNISCGNLDFKISGKGVWDDCDLNANGKSLSIKSAAFFSNLLLLESRDYDMMGNYLPNQITGATASYDYYILVRIKPDIKSKLKEELHPNFSVDICKTELSSIISHLKWEYDIPGWISHEELVSVIKSRTIIPQNALLNRRIIMDADNYYVQSGDLHAIDLLCEHLK